MRRALLLITGGPGTGKTTTIAKLLVLRIAQAAQAGDAPLRIALAAPTGRAADRMAESLQRARRHMRADGIAEEVLAALPASASTLHRLLGVIPDSPQFRHNADNPLPFDIVVVDEASMVDLPLMCKLTEAVATGAQLILLGDPDQLPSVEAGDVLASMLHMQPCRVHLTRGWRQSDTLHLAPLADAMRRGDADATLALLRGETLSNVHFHEGATDPLSVRGLDLIGHYRRLATHTDPAQALTQANQVRLLTAVREGPQGARGLNARIEAQLTGQHFGKPPAWFPGRLILITENSYRHGLFNGDVGICLPDDAGQSCVWFAGSDGVRGFHPASLPTHESAFAMTVHKAQGSEFEHVVFQLPTRDAKVLTRELLYTAITRARSVLHMAGNAEVIRTALARHSSRISGLAARLA
jgi:exodeoxyribonuclease V alpha subunit